jgi:hypothetical protein
LPRRGRHQPLEGPVEVGLIGKTGVRRHLGDGVAAAQALRL